MMKKTQSRDTSFTTTLRGHAQSGGREKGDFWNFLLESYNTFLKNSCFLLKIASSTVYRDFFI